MPFVARLAACAILALAMVAPASAPAAVRTLKGQVVGTAYAVGSRMAVPALLDARSVQRAKLRSPLVRVLVPRTRKLRAPGGTILPQYLRAGDAIGLRVTAPRRRNGAAYPSLTPRAGTFAVTRRGTTLSAAELQEQLSMLYGYVGSLTSYVLVQFADLRGQVTGLRADLGGLQSALTALQARVATLEASPANLTTLIERVTTLETQLASITTQLSQLTSSLTTVQNLLTGVAPGDLADALSDIAALQALVGGIDVGALSTQVSSLTSKIGAVGDTDLQTQVDQVNAALAAQESQLDYLCSAGLVTGPLLNLQLLGSCPT